MIAGNKKAEKRIRKGDLSVFEELFHSWYPSMCSFAFSIVKSEHIAEEIVQDVFYGIWKNRATLVVTTNWKTYLFSAVYKNALMVIRKNLNLRKMEMRTNSDTFNEVDPSSVLITNELNSLVESTLDSLPPRTSEIFRLNRMDGMKYKEIAEKLSVSVKTVEANMGKALQAFRIALQDYRK